MDLRAYYKKIREFESTIDEADVVVVSHATRDGGRDGVRTEVPRGVAARMLADGQVRLATEEESSEFRNDTRRAHETALQQVTSSRGQVVVVPGGQTARAKKER